MWTWGQRKYHILFHILWFMWGGGTFCCVGSLYMLGALDRIRDRETLIHWCIMKQGKGFCGRTNKKADTCYSFWYVTHSSLAHRHLSTLIFLKRLFYIWILLHSWNKENFLIICNHLLFPKKRTFYDKLMFQLA